MKTGFKGVPNISGRPKGSLNRTTQRTKKAIEKIVSNELKNIDELLGQLEPKERLDVLIKLLPYIVPKNRHIEVDVDVQNHQFQPVTLTVIEQPLEIAENEH